MFLNASYLKNQSSVFMYTTSGGSHKRLVNLLIKLEVALWMYEDGEANIHWSNVRIHKSKYSPSSERNAQLI